MAIDMLLPEVCSIRIWGGYFTSQPMSVWTSLSDMILRAIQVLYLVAKLHRDIYICLKWFAYSTDIMVRRHHIWIGAQVKF